MADRAAASADGPAAEAGSGGLFGTLMSWGGAAIGYASQQINSFLGWEDLDVVDPDAEEAAKGDKAVGEGVLTDERKQAWGTKQFQQYIGMDVTSLLSVPVFIMEPFTILQKAAEIMEYTDLLDQADQAEDPHERFAWLAAYCVSPFGANERAWKPFNPILGETFEVEVGKDVKYVAEQVSHHPPVCAAHAENEHFAYDLVSAPTTRFLGNSLEVYPLGRTRLTLKRSGEVYTLCPPNAMVHNIVIGRTWVDVAGQMTIHCPTTGAKCLIDFTPCGWFSYGRYEFVGHVYDADGMKRLRLSGKWVSHCDSVPCNAEGEALEGAEPKRLWTCTPRPAGDYYGFTSFAHRLNSSEGIKVPLPSDSRRRPDRAALSQRQMTQAGSEKYRLEEMQRAEKREREKRGESWVPRWFTHVEGAEPLTGELPAEKVPFYSWTGTYEQPSQEVGDAKQIDGAGFNPWQFPTIHESL